MTIKTQDGEAVQVGGVTRVTFGTADPADQTTLKAPHEASRVSTGPLRWNGHGVTSAGVTRYQTGQDFPTHSVAATLKRDSNGLSVELVPGQSHTRTTIATALRDGLIREISPGIYDDVRAVSAPGAGEPPPEVREPADAQPFAWVDAEHTAEWNELVAPVPQPAIAGAVAAALSSISTGDGSMVKAVRRLSEASGMNPAQAAVLVETGEAMFRENLTRDLTSTALISREEIDAFYDYCRGHRRLPEALSALMGEGKTTVFRSLAQEWAVRARQL